MSATNVNIQWQSDSPKPPRRKGEKKRIDLNSKKTLNANKSAAKILKKNLTVRDEVENFEEFDAVKLDLIFSSSLAL